MADVRNEKQIKKDQSSVREEREALLEDLPGDSGTKPLVKNSNRDRSRGDWDRTGDHHDEEPGRTEE